jgi:hypothetical protein
LAPNRLFVDEIVSIGLVAAGDNPDATVEIYKSHGKPVSIPDRTESPQFTPGAEMDLSGMKDQDLRKSIEDHIAESEQKISDLQTELDKTVEPDPVDEASDEVKAVLKEQEDALEQVRKELADERTARRTAEYISKAEPLAGLLGKPDEVGPVLAELADKAPDAYAKLEGALVAASQRDDLAKLFSEIGTGDSEGETDPIAKRDDWVAKNKTSDETDTQARARFWVENPEAKEESRN